MSLDLSTLYLVATLVGALLGCLLLYFGRQERILALAWWGCAYLLGSASIALWVVLGHALGNIIALAIGFVACGMVWNAARVFHGCRPNWPGLFLGAVAWLAAIVSLPAEAATTQVTIGAVIVAIYVVLTASQLAAERRKAMRRRWLTVVVPLLHGVVLLLPILLGDLLWPHDEGFTRSAWVTAFAIELILYAVGTVFVIFMLVSERTVRAHKAAASVDPLTGMFNRRGFAEATSRMIAREAKAGRPVTVMIFDIDHFKSVNDRFGHPAGDEVLKMFSAIVTNTLRTTDLCGRIGGEEFAALLPCSIDEAVIAAERVRAAFETSGISVDDTPITTTVSIGVASAAPLTELDVLLAAADTGLYQAKRSGRNRVVAVGDELAPTAVGPTPEAPVIGASPQRVVRRIVVSGEVCP
ncbi:MULTISPECIES: GGDEF domain-containing protein [Rhodopseudomonas]|uniref:GGDEF domain-containing protein n=1 Tax=Rhodopseudomonas TaxID=1073 RepID=UPI0005C8E2C6|nr:MULTISPECIES: GGDEF domain-containing protein [Rhodopseudomonas]MDF3808818.1 GGDEF domain-containing protein [Rhodopseudomonas sp. BAL398]WOK19149.1 GGDEF domain-containing protein [Rhodopseudomonas sp. BAL398]